MKFSTIDKYAGICFQQHVKNSPLAYGYEVFLLGLFRITRYSPTIGVKMTDQTKPSRNPSLNWLLMIPTVMQENTYSAQTAMKRVEADVKESSSNIGQFCRFF